MMKDNIRNSIEDASFDQTYMLSISRQMTRCTIIFGDNIYSFGGFQDMGTRKPIQDQLIDDKYNINKWIESNMI